MAFDGITIAAMVKELHLNLDGGRFNKIAQPEADELLITGKGANGQCRLLLSASASLPLIYFTSKNITITFLIRSHKSRADTIKPLHCTVYKIADCYIIDVFLKKECECIFLGNAVQFLFQIDGLHPVQLKTGNLLLLLQAKPCLADLLRLCGECHG